MKRAPMHLHVPAPPRAVNESTYSFQHFRGGHAAHMEALEDARRVAVPMYITGDSYQSMVSPSCCAQNMHG